jgi:ankyrin repeat protein
MLMYEARCGHLDRVLWLLKRGVPLDARDAEGLTAMSWAIVQGRTDRCCAVVMAAVRDIDTANNKGWTRLIAADYCYNIVRALIAAGAGVNIAGNDGETPLQIACCYGVTDTAIALLKGGADVNIASNDNVTPLIIASRNGYTDVVLVLLSAGARVDIADNDGATPLFAASSSKVPDTVRALLEAGAEIDIADNDGATPLFAASSQAALKSYAHYSQLEPVSILQITTATRPSTSPAGRATLPLSAP